jgi:tetratricopeptide (TPR) repeat protein
MNKTTVHMIITLAPVLLAAAGVNGPPCGMALDSGNALYAKFENQQALYRFAAAFRQCPDSYEPLMKMTRALIDAGEDINGRPSEKLYVEGLRYADTMLQRYPDSGQSYFLSAIAAANLARIKKGMKRVSFAMILDRNIQKSIELTPGFAPAYVVRGAFFREVAVASPVLKAFVGIFYGWKPQGTLKDSQRSLQKALELSPGNMYACLELSRTYNVMGNKKQAIVLLEQMQELPIAWHQDARLKQDGRRLLKDLQN